MFYRRVDIEELGWLLTHRDEQIIAPIQLCPRDPGVQHDPGVSSDSQCDSFALLEPFERPRRQHIDGIDFSNDVLELPNRGPPDLHLVEIPLREQEYARGTIRTLVERHGHGPHVTGISHARSLT